MDAFYAAIEQRDRPELRGKPVIVGAEPSGRGVVSAASYEARVYGVRSAMPISTAARLCPHGAFVPVDMAKYRRVSTEIMAVLDEFSPLVEPISVDEAFIDLTGTESLFGPPVEAVRTIKRRIRERTDLSASAGLAPNKFLAKIASDLEKPDGLVVVAAGGEAAFLALAIGRLWGVEGDGRGAVRTRDHDDRSAAAHAARRPDPSLRPARRRAARPGVRPRRSARGAVHRAEIDGRRRDVRGGLP